jgi:hypothetical protein
MTQLYQQDGISGKDRQRLRAIVKREHFKHYPKEFITDREADMFIESLLPETVSALVKKSVDVYGN